MATKPNVENRIISILDEKMNRHGVTLRRAMGVLFVVSIGVAVLATLAATTGDKVAADDIDIVEETPIKYPFCIVEVDDLKPRSLANAISAFNKEAQESPTGVLQSPITEQETLVAISKFVDLEHVAEPTKSMLHEIVETKVLPAKAYFRRFTRFDDERQMHGVWWVRLFVEGKDAPVYSVPVRTTPIFARPYTQLERQQNAGQGLSLINRFTSYFEETPSVRMKEDFPREAPDRLTGPFAKALFAKDLDAMKELFHWQGASDSTREFVTSELQMLLNATLHSIKIEPRTLNGNLIHWSAYQHYQPNLPVEGYLHIAYTPDDPSTSPPNSPESYLLEKGDILRVYIEGVLPYIQPPSASASPPRIPIEGNARLDPSIGFPIVVQENGTISLPSIAPILVRGMSVRQATKLIKKTYLDAKIFTQPERLMPVVSVIKKPTTHPKRILSLELGKIGNEFRLVNYVTLGERKLPKGLVEGLSIRGNIEPLADGTHLQTDLITNPGSLISAHLANEEIRQRGFENKKNAILLPGRGVFQQFQGKITEVENDGDIVFINLGKADALRPRVRFGVVDSSVERVADAKPKAQIEVVEVLTTSEHLSRCKVLAIRGSSTIQKGDLIYSPAWHPGKKVEFALIGKMDMDGDGEDDRETVKAMIESNGGLVTLDLPPDGKVTGELTMDTRWLVIGEDVNTLDQGGLLQAKAKWFGISRINLNKLSGWLRGSNAIVIPPK